VDLNDDGHLDILSGSYSRMEQDMAGTFQVLWGKEDGTFSPAETLNGTDGQPLLIPGSREENMTDRICTRPTAADINGDGHLDIVTGNFTGTFYVFRGEGQGKFTPECELIKAGDDPLQVPSHSDPFPVDWDNDGDLDIVSGSASGGVFLAINAGTKTEPTFPAVTKLIPPVGHSSDANEPRLGDSHVSGPQSATRVWVDDVNQDGKLDLLVGDSVRLMFPAEGVNEEEALAKMDEWDEQQQELMTWWMEASKDLDHEAMNRLQLRKRELEVDSEEDDDKASDENGQASGGENDNEDPNSLSEEELAKLEAYEKIMEEYRERSQELYKSRNEFVRDQMTGFVWVLYQQ
jgi:hypothetical protein